MRFFERPSAGPGPRTDVEASRWCARGVKALRKEDGPVDMDDRSPDAPPSRWREAVFRPCSGRQGPMCDRNAKPGLDEKRLDRLEERQ